MIEGLEKRFELLNEKVEQNSAYKAASLFCAVCSPNLVPADLITTCCHGICESCHLNWTNACLKSKNIDKPQNVYCPTCKQDFKVIKMYRNLQFSYNLFSFQHLLNLYTQFLISCYLKFLFQMLCQCYFFKRLFCVFYAYFKLSKFITIKIIDLLCVVCVCLRYKS